MTAIGGKRMKKIIALLLGIASAFALASCKGSGDGGEEASSSSRASLGWEYSDDEEISETSETSESSDEGSSETGRSEEHTSELQSPS